VKVCRSITDKESTMKALVGISFMALAIAAGITASQASPADGCVSKSLHGVWDCR
jgi:hypothetical protein